jgi:hypothetical protein
MGTGVISEYALSHPHCTSIARNGENWWLEADRQGLEARWACLSPLNPEDFPVYIYANIEWNKLRREDQTNLLMRTNFGQGMLKHPFGPQQNFQLKLGPPIISNNSGLHEPLTAPHPLKWLHSSRL